MTEGKKINTLYLKKTLWYLFLLFHSLYGGWMISGLTFTESEKCGGATTAQHTTLT